tara:strand:+ start:943 stop:1143 length:201 start_codon:yes stop_codon:yes gene_type:complete
MNYKPHIDRINESIIDTIEGITDHLTNPNRNKTNSEYIINCFLEIETLTVAKILMELHDKNFTREK